MQERIKQLFSNLKWYETAEYAAMALYVIAVPIHWRLGIWALALLILSATVKAIATRRVGNPTLPKASRLCLLVMILYYLLYLFSIHYSNSPLGGFAVLGKKLPIILIPIFFLFSNHGYVQRKHVTVLNLLLAAVLTIRFCIMLAQAILDLMAGEVLKQVIHAHFDPMHYNYLALYIVTAIILLFFEAMRYWNKPKWKKWRWLLVADMVVMVQYILILGSRSGLLTMIMVVATLAGYLILLKQYKMGTIMALSFALFLGLNHLITPDLFSRAESTIEKMENGEDGDVRQEIWKCGLDLVEDHEVLGYGNEGYRVELYREYIEHDLTKSFKEKHNLHNQYLESLVATGAIGLIVFLIMVIMPAILALTRKYWNPVMVVFTILYASWLFFEEGFSRQMGLLFICWWYCALLTFAKHYPSPKVSLPLTHKRKAIKGKEIHS